MEIWNTWWQFWDTFVAAAVQEKPLETAASEGTKTVAIRGNGDVIEGAEMWWDGLCYLTGCLSIYHGLELPSYEIRFQAKKSTQNGFWGSQEDALGADDESEGQAQDTSLAFAPSSSTHQRWSQPDSSIFGIFCVNIISDGGVDDDAMMMIMIMMMMIKCPHATSWLSIFQLNFFDAVLESCFKCEILNV